MSFLRKLGVVILVVSYWLALRHTSDEGEPALSKEAGKVIEADQVE